MNPNDPLTNGNEELVHANGTAKEASGLASSFLADLMRIVQSDADKEDYCAA